MLLEPADNPDVRETAGTATAEGHADRGPRSGGVSGGRFLVGDIRRRRGGGGGRALEVRGTGGGECCQEGYGESNGTSG